MQDNRIGTYNGSYRIIDTVENNSEGVALAVKETNIGREYATWFYPKYGDYYYLGHYFSDYDNIFPYKTPAGYDAARSDFKKRALELVEY